MATFYHRQSRTTEGKVATPVKPEQTLAWMHDGTRPSIARVVKIGQDPQTRRLGVVANAHQQQPPYRTR